jgi:DNA-directed RNA polymerase I, II, and III subunit RPABC2
VATTTASLCKLLPPRRDPLDSLFNLPRSGDEPAFDEDPDEYYEPEPEAADADDTAVAPAGEGEQDTDHVVASGDPNAAANTGRGNEKSHKDKKIPNDQRATTPFMTKYEKARILGTRALQIRWVIPDGHGRLGLC